jgi:hypothetical protein
VGPNILLPHAPRQENGLALVLDNQGWKLRGLGWLSRLPLANEVATRLTPPRSRQTLMAGHDLPRGSPTTAPMAIDKSPPHFVHAVDKASKRRALLDSSGEDG